MNSIELNTTFYRIPAESTVLNWKSSVPEDFRFCPKVYQGISQFGQLVQIPELTQRFFESVQHFGQQLGICFLQLPPHFGPDRILILKRFFKLLPSQIRLAIEFRHPGWFQNHRLVGSVFELLSEFQISTVMTDAVGRTDVLHTSLSTPRVMIRFLGNSLHPSDYSRLDQWIGALGQWFEGGVEEVYFFVHQPEEEGVIELVQYVVESLNERYGSAFDIRLQGIDLQRAQPQIELL
jgi:hypothetical protein